MKITVIINAEINPKLYISGKKNFGPKSSGIKQKFSSIIIIIDIVERMTVISAGRYDAEVITGAKINIENGLMIPPVRKSKNPNCNVSNNK